MYDTKHRSLLLVALPALFLAGACSQSPGEITQSAEPFAAIAPDATITVLGNEPFWNIRILPQAGTDVGALTATYSSPENLDGTDFAVSRFAGNNGLGFSGMLGGEPVQLALTPGDCSDTMSDRSYPYTATLSLGETLLTGCAYTSDEPFSGDPSP